MSNAPRMRFASMEGDGTIREAGLDLDEADAAQGRRAPGTCAAARCRVPVSTPSG